MAPKVDQAPATERASGNRYEPSAVRPDVKMNGVQTYKDYKGKVELDLW